MPRNKYPEETVRKILDVSLKLFLEKGYEQTTVLDIVDNLGGMTRGAFYHHFKSKEEVFLALSEKLFYDNNPFEAVENMKEASGLEKIKAIWLGQMANDPSVYPTLVQAAVSLLQQPRFLAEQVKNNQKTAKMFEPLIEEGIADGSIRGGNAKLLAELSLLLANFWLMPSVFPCSRAEFAEKALMIQQIFDNLGFPIADEKSLKAVDSLADLLGVPPAP